MKRPLVVGALLLVVAAVVAYLAWPRARSAPAKVAAPAPAAAISPGTVPPAPGTTARPRPQLTTAPDDAAPPAVAPSAVIDHRSGGGVGAVPASSGSGSGTPRVGPGVAVMKSLQDMVRPKVLACTQAVPADQRVTHASTKATMAASVKDGVLTVESVDVATLDVQEPAATALVECVRTAIAGTQVPAGADATGFELSLTFPVR